MKYVLARASAMVLAIGLGGCGPEASVGSLGGEPEAVREKLDAVTVDPAATFTVKLPKQVAVPDSVLTASGTISLNDRATVLSASGKGAISTTGTGRPHRGA